MVSMSTAGAAQAPTPAPQSYSLPKTPVDFSISSADLACGIATSMSKGYVRPEVKLQLQAKVFKNTPGAAGGGKVNFLLDGNLVNSIPFFFDTADEYQIVKAYYILPLDNYLNLAEGDQVPLSCEAQVEPGALTSDFNTGNNTARINTFVQGIELVENDSPANASIVSFETSSDIGNGVAKPAIT